jgi:hypothetical protein
MCSSSGRPLVHADLYVMFMIHSCKQSSRGQDVLDVICCKIYSSTMNILFLFVVCFSRAATESDLLEGIVRSPFEFNSFYNSAACTTDKNF